MNTTTQNERPCVFLDTSAFAAYLNGRGAAAHLFDPEVLSRVRYAVNPVVLHEIFLLADEQRRPELAQLINDRVRVLPIDPDKTNDLLQRARNFRNRIAHSNDILIFASALDCDYLVTDDRALAQLRENGRPEVLTAEQFLVRVSAGS